MEWTTRFHMKRPRCGWIRSESCTTKRGSEPLRVRCVCLYDDIDKFTVGFEDGCLYISCGHCGHRRVVDGPDLAEGTEAVAGSTSPVVCDCGNDNIDLFDVQYNSAGTPDLLTCFICKSTYVGHFRSSDANWHDLGSVPQQSSIRDVGVRPEARGTDIADVFRAEDKTPKHGSEVIVGRTDITDITQLQKGDHITWYRSLGYDHHAIVVAIRPSLNQIKIIHYSSPDKKHGTKGIIVEEWLTLDCGKDRIARQDYRQCYDPQQVIDRARSRIGEIEYNLLLNNCEHFARWCKTGVRESAQAKGALKRIERSFAHCKNAIVQLVVSVVAHVSDKEFARVCIERASEGIGAEAGKVLGSTLTVQIPLVGSSFGCKLGDLVGRAIGRVGGRKLANFVLSK